MGNLISDPEEKYRLRKPENEALRRIFRLKRDDVAGASQFLFLVKLTTVLKLRETQCSGHVARTKMIINS
jgi:hypothetical protein